MSSNVGKLLTPHGRSVLVTGASSGLGRVCALELERIGFQVFAGVRKKADGEDLAAEAASDRLTPVRLDVTDDEGVRSSVAEVDEAVGERGLWGVVNNAGVCVSAPLECVTPEQLRWQLNTNVVGQLAVTRAVMPMLRRSQGRVVNVTSGLGSVALPYLGAYAMAQFAKEAFSDVLRREVRSFGVDVSVVQPGAIMTPIWGKVTDVGLSALDAVPESIAELYRIPFNRFLGNNEKGARNSPTRPEDFARVVFGALVAKRPKTRYRVGKDARSAALFKRVLPDRALDRNLRAITQ